MSNPPPASDARSLARWGVRAVALGALGLGLWFVLEARRALPPPAPAVGSAATLLPVPTPLPEFQLVDDGGEPFARERLAGRWSFLFFGYAHCPSICPMTLSTMRDMHRELSAGDPAYADTQYVFVSVDPERDSPEALRRYVQHFDPDFVGATGDREEIARLTRELGVFHERVPGESTEEYDFDHTVSLLLVDPEARLHAVFSPPIDPLEAADAFRAIRRLDEEARS
jgi:protein SCO1/2